MGDRALRRAAWLSLAVTVAAAVAQGVLLATAGVPALSPAALDEAFPIVTAAVVVGAAVGAVIVDRHPRHRIGWLFCAGNAGAAIGLAVQGLVLPGNAWLGAPAFAAGIARLFGASWALALLGLLLLIVPDGRIPSRRWWPVAGLLVAGWATVPVALLLPAPGVGLVVGGQLAVIAGLVGSAVALVVRLRRARGVERTQLRWIATAAAALAGALVVLIADLLRRQGEGPVPWPVQVLFHLGYLAVPVATGFAVLRYRLYGIDVIIGRTVRLAAVAVFVTAGYVAVVVAAGTLLGGTLLPSLLAYVLVALAFQPLRRRVDRLAERVVHGERAEPYESLAALTRSLRGTSGTDVLVAVARSCVDGVGARSATVTAHVPGGADINACWPPGGSGGPLRIDVTHRGDAVGRIDLDLPRALTRAEQRLLDALAAGAGLAFRNVALAADLRIRAATLAAQRDELAASRRRLREAVDAEREQVAAAIRTQVAAHLDAFPAQPEPAEVPALQAATERALAGLRAVTAGILPPLLARRGLVAALTDAAVSRPGRLAATPRLDGRRFAPSVEAAAYRSGVVALDQPGATVDLDADPDRLTLTIRGGPALPREVLDRIDAVGGQLAAEPGVVSVALPAADQAARSAAGPNSDFGT